MKIIFTHPNPGKIETALNGRNKSDIIFVNNRFEYIDQVDKTSDKIFFLPVQYLFSCEKYFINKIGKSRQTPFFLYDFQQSDESTIKQLLESASITKDRNKVAIPSDLRLIKDTWEKCSSYIISHLTPGFIHNISSPVTALAGRAELAKITKKNLSEDVNFYKVIQKMTEEIKQIQWLLESLDYKSNQKFTLLNAFQKITEVGKADLAFKHKINTEINRKSFENASLFTSLYYFNILFLSIFKELASKANSDRPFDLNIKLDNKINRIAIVLTATNKFDIQTFEDNGSHQDINQLLWLYLHWNYLLPSGIKIESSNQFESTIITVTFPI